MGTSITAAFFLSGFAGLMHEVVWSKLLASLIGTTAHAQAAVLVVYMGGLALGSVTFGRRTDRVGRPLRTYMLLEFAIAAYCLFLPTILTAAGDGYVAIAGYVFESAQLKFALRFAIALATVLLPAVLMGGTLPLLARRLIGRPSETRRRVAALYTVNNFGAVFGAAVAGFLTLPLLGIYPSVLIASAANVIAGMLVLSPARRETEAAAGAPRQTKPRSSDSPLATPTYGAATYAATLLALTLSGFAAMGYEVVFIRIIALAFGASTYSFTVMLMSFITGIGLGSLLVMRLQIRRPLWMLGLSQLVVAVVFATATPLLARLPYLVGLVRIASHQSAFGFLSYQLGSAFLCLLVLLAPTMCIGASFPLVAAVQARHPARIGSAVGSTYACNTLGNVLGVLVTTLVLLPAVGLLGAFHVNLTLSGIAGLVVLAVAREVAPAWRSAAVGAAAAILAVYATVGTGWTQPLLFGVNHLNLNAGPDAQASAAARAAHPSASFANWQNIYVLKPVGNRLLHLEEEAHANVVAAEVSGEISLIVNTKIDASTEGLDLETQLLLAHAPLFMRPQAHTLLVIGYGSGITLGSALRHPLERADVVEISDAVLNVDFAFAPYNYNVLRDPRVHVYLDDAQSFLRTVPRRYDVIVSEPSNPWIAGIAGLFTVEFFEQARNKLEPNGVFALWFHEYDQNNESIALILRTLRSVFPYATLFHEQAYSDVVAIASENPLAVDFAALEDRFDEPGVRDDLARIGISNLAALLSHHAISPERFTALAGTGPVNRIAHQRLEYDALRAMFEMQNADLIEISNPLLSKGAGPTDALLDQYIAYRAQLGEPLRRTELESAARHMSVRGNFAAEIRDSLMARAERAPPTGSPAIRSSRGAALEATTAGYYESLSAGRDFAAANDLDNAIAFYRRATQLRPDDIPTVLRLSDLLAAAGDPDAASALVDTALARNPESLALLAQRPWLYIRERRFTDAREALLKLVAQREVLGAYRMIGHLLEREGKKKEAEPFFQRAAAAPPSARVSNVSGLLARLLFEQGEDAEALRIVERALQDEPQHAQLLELRDAFRLESHGERGAPGQPAATGDDTAAAAGGRDEHDPHGKP